MDNAQRQLVRRIQSGDSRAEHELFEKYRKAVLWKVTRSVESDNENIKDLVSEIWLALLESLRRETFDPNKRQSLDAYVWGVTNNKIHDWFKKSKLEKKVFNPVSLTEDLAKYTEEYLFEHKEIAQQLRTMLRALPHKYKVVLDLRYFKELSIGEISERLGLPRGRVSERIHYALKLMRKAYKKNFVNI